MIFSCNPVVCILGGRSYLLPAGDEHKPFIRDANKMVSRLILICFVAACCKCRLFIEQPVTSLMPRYFRFQWLLEMFDIYCLR